MIKRVVITGGNANNTANTGTFYLNVNNDSSNANQNIGTRVKFYGNINHDKPHHLVKYMSAKKCW